jgi:hypothetical protein
MHIVLVVVAGVVADVGCGRAAMNVLILTPWSARDAPRGRIWYAAPFHPSFMA